MYQASNLSLQLESRNLGILPIIEPIYVSHQGADIVGTLECFESKPIGIIVLGVGLIEVQHGEGVLQPADTSGHDFEEEGRQQREVEMYPVNADSDDRSDEKLKKISKTKVLQPQQYNTSENKNVRKIITLIRPKMNKQ